MIKMAKGTTPEDIDREIARLKAQEYGYGLTTGQYSKLLICYAWLEQYYSKEVNN